MKSFPLFLNLQEKVVVIAGGGEQAAQKARLIARTDAQLAIWAPELNAELSQMVALGRAQRLGPDALDATLGDAALFFAATGCAAADAALCALARAHGVLVNAVDRPELCDVTTPAIVDRDPVVVAIGTEGTAPVLAREIKTRVEEMLEPSLGRFATLAGALRAQVARHVPAARRRAYWEWALDFPRRLFAQGRETEAHEMMTQAITSGQAPICEPGLVSLVGAGPGSADMITLRGVQRLQTADVIFYDRLVDPALLELARRDAERILVGKAPGGIGWKQGQINNAIVQAASEGLKVVRLKCGDPGIFGRGLEEAAALDEAGISWEIVAGVTAASAAAADARLFLTEREEIRTVVLTTGQGAHDRPVGDWIAHARPGTAVAFYMAVAAAGEVERELLAAGVPADATIDIIQDATRPEMRRIETKLGRLADTISRERIMNPAILLMRQPLAAASSTVIPLAEKRRAHADERGAKGNGILKIATHPH